MIAGLEAHESSPKYYSYTQGKRVFCYETNVASGDTSVSSSVGDDVAATSSSSTSGKTVTVRCSTTQYKPTHKYGHRNPATQSNSVGGMVGAVSSASTIAQPTSWPCLGPLNAVSDLAVY